MSLPRIDTPTYTLDLPSTGEKIKYRPFLVKEQKILMMAEESENEQEITDAVGKMVNSCTFGAVDPINAPMFDVEYIFLQIRSKSVGEVSKVKILCPDDKKTYTNVEIDLNEVKVQVEDEHTNKIELTDSMGMIMTYPNIDSFTENGIQDINASNMLDVIGTCILQIYEDKGEKVYEAKDQTKKELVEFIEQLNTKQFQDVQKFFDTMPRLKHTIKVKNPKTKKTSDVTLSGLNDFFA